MSTSRRLALVPRDGFFCKDGRGWYTTGLGRGHGTTWPWPSTVLGALRSAWGRGLEQRVGRRLDGEDWRERTREIALGASLALRRPLGTDWAPAHRVWPAPADARKLKGRAHLVALRPRPPDPGKPRTLGRDDDPAREALWHAIAEEEAEKPEELEPWWGEEQLVAWLAGEELPAEPGDGRFRLPRRLQTHVTIRPERLTAEEGRLFAHDVVETLESPPLDKQEPGAEWAIGVEVVLPDPSLPGRGRLGADGRLVGIEPLTERLFEPPTRLLAAFGRGSSGIRLVVVTPACFADGWLPDGLKRDDEVIRGHLPGIEAELVLRAAIVNRPIHVSGWDMAANRPKSVSRMVPSGSVYFLARNDGGRFGEVEARALWLAALGSRTEEGYGRVVPGVWDSEPRRS
jgi:CRISPR-associated protein Cmr3